MSYTKQTHVAGQKLTAAQLNHMENGIVAAQNAYNLLDNSNFTNPVNQRGSTEYAYGSTKYTIDRWVTYCGVKVNDGYITVFNNHTSDPYNFYQDFPLGTFDESKTYTGAMKLATGELYVGNGVPVEGGTIDLFKGGDFEISIRKNYSNTAKDRFYVQLKAGASLNILWIAFYEGEYTAETLPAYMPKGYGAELAECQRYYENSWFNSTKSTDNEYIGVCVHASGLDAMVTYRVPKRIAATVTFYPTSPSETWRVYNDAGYRPLASVAAHSRNGIRGFMIRGMKDTVNDTSVWTHGKAILLFGQWEASADV